ncbi:cytidylate kinase family protein [Candidatus Curtissbacteria bacterium]|nr:cytidylate kinase family protein [Candidatus Curtissbacteria bacterium]
MKYSSITISGPVASGTSTAAKTLAVKFNLAYLSAGDFFRKYMIDHNIPLPEKVQIPDEVDRKIDKELTDLAASQKPVIIDSLYHGYFTRNMPHVLKVLLTADEDVRIKRALLRIHTHKETAEDVKRRDQTHDIKFRKLYADEGFLDPKFFDLVIDTTATSKEQVVVAIAKKFQENI